MSPGFEVFWRVQFPLVCRNRSVFRALIAGRHFDELGIEPRDDFNEVTLGSHDFIDVFIAHRHFIESR